MEITYEKIKPLIVKEEINGNQINVSFKAANQTTPLDTVAVVVPDQNQMMKSATKSAVKTSVFSSAFSWVGRLLGRSIGGVGGSIASSATSSAGSAMASNQMQKDMDKAMTGNITEEAKQTAIVNAFQPYLTMYEWNSDQNCFLSKN